MIDWAGMQKIGGEFKTCSVYSGTLGVLWNIYTHNEKKNTRLEYWLWRLSTLQVYIIIIQYFWYLFEFNLDFIFFKNGPIVY